MTHVYLVRDNVYGGDLIYSTYEAACAKAKKIAGHERSHSKEELKSAITDECTIWYRGNYYSTPIVTVTKLEILTT